jgi:hypothetical protein
LLLIRQAGSTVTLLGSKFGASDYSLGVLVGQSEAAQCTWISDTAMVVRVRPGVQDEWGVLVTIDGKHGNSIAKAYFYDPPVASSVSIKNGPTTGGTRLSLFGNNFGYIDYSPTVSVGTGKCTDVQWKSVCALICCPKKFLSQ